MTQDKPDIQAIIPYEVIYFATNRTCSYVICHKHKTFQNAVNIIPVRYTEKLYFITSVKLIGVEPRQNSVLSF